MAGFEERYICNFKKRYYDEEAKKWATFVCGSQAKDAKEIIDAPSIVGICTEIAKAAGEVATINNNITAKANEISKSDLSIEGTGVEHLSTNFEGQANLNVGTNISEHVTTVGNDATDLFNQYQREYNKDAKEVCEGSMFPH